MLEIPDPSLPPPPNQRKVRVGAQTTCNPYEVILQNTYSEVFFRDSSRTLSWDVVDAPFQLAPLSSSSVPSLVEAGVAHTATPTMMVDLCGRDAAIVVGSDVRRTHCVHLVLLLVWWLLMLVWWLLVWWLLMLVGVRVSAVGKVGRMSCAGGRFSSLIFHCLHFVAAAELDLLIQ